MRFASAILAPVTSQLFDHTLEIQSRNISPKFSVQATTKWPAVCIGLSRANPNSVQVTLLTCAFVRPSDQIQKSMGGYHCDDSIVVYPRYNIRAEQPTHAFFGIEVPPGEHATTRQPHQ
jgi:hypothetical protein